MRDFYLADWHIQPQLNRISADGQTYQLEPRVMRVLVCLAQHPHKVVSRDTLYAFVWGNQVVNEGALTRAISDLRKLFKDDPNNPQFIETIRMVGYRLVSPIHHEAPLLKSSETSQPLTPTRYSSSRVALVIASLVLVFLAGVIVIRAIRLPMPTPPLHPLPVTSAPQPEFDPALSPDGTRLAYVMRTDQYHIYLKDLGSANPIQLTEHPHHTGSGFDGSPSWSPDGKHIAFMRSSPKACGVFIQAVTNRDAKQIVPCSFHLESSVAWSPDGRFIAFSDRASSEAPFQIFLVSLGTRMVQPLTFPPSHYYGDLDPAFSPDGKSLAFVRGVVESPLPRIVSPVIGDIHVVSVDQGETRQLTFDQQEIPGLYWTPDGKEIIFSSNREAGTFGLWRVSVEQGTIHWLLHTGAMVRNPTLSAKSNRLLYEQWEGDLNIWRITQTLDSLSAPEPFITSTQFESTPHYSPDGSRIAFTSSRSGFMEIWTARADGKQAMQLTMFEGPHTTLARWSPDGRWIAFQSYAQGNADIYVIAAEGGVPYRLTASTANDMAPSWSSDGKSIYFGSNRSDSWQIWNMPFSSEQSHPPAALRATQVTHHGGFAAFETTSNDTLAVYYIRLNVQGLWRKTLDSDNGEETLFLPDIGYKNWGNWMLASDGVYFVRYAGWRKASVVYYNFTTQTTDTLTTIKGNLVLRRPGLAVSPNGMTVLYTQVDRSSGDIMMIDGFH